jgi:hypothetical protein
MLNAEDPADEEVGTEALQARSKPARRPCSSWRKRLGPGPLGLAPGLLSQRLRPICAGILPMAGRAFSTVHSGPVFSGLCPGPPRPLTGRLITVSPPGGQHLLENCFRGPPMRCRLPAQRIWASTRSWKAVSSVCQAPVGADADALSRTPIPGWGRSVDEPRVPQAPASFHRLSLDISGAPWRGTRGGPALVLHPGYPFRKRSSARRGPGRGGTRGMTSFDRIYYGGDLPHRGVGGRRWRRWAGNRGRYFFERVGSAGF